MSFPARILLEGGRLTGKVLDYVCGKGRDVQELKKHNIDIIGYDPFYFLNRREINLALFFVSMY